MQPWKAMPGILGQPCWIAIHLAGGLEERRDLFAGNIVGYLATRGGPHWVRELPQTAAYSRLALDAGHDLL